MPDDFRLIPVSNLIDPPLVLRQVNQRSVEYTELRDSLAKDGLLNSICVRPSGRQEGKFEVVDGRWRTAAAREVNIIEIPCIVKRGLTDKDVLAMQITANAARPTTRPSEYAKQIRRLLKSKEGMTQAELCQLLHKHPRWVCKMLGMARLARYKTFRPAIDRGELSLEAAYFLTRLPVTQWGEYFTEATVLPLREFKALVMALLRQRRMELNAGSLRMELLPTFEPTPFLRPLTDFLDEIEIRQTGPLMVTATDCKTALDGWYCALTWAIHLDSKSIERQRARVLQRLKKRVVQRVEAEKADKAVASSS
jgi:ParB/RepB/Spo0J family partition protein